MLKFSKLKDEVLINEEEKSNKKINHLLDNLVNSFIFIFKIL